MSIRDRQIRKATEKIVEEELKSGIYPSPNKIKYRLQRYFKDNIPGFPRTKLRYWPYREKSNPKDFNKFQEEVYDDLSNLYEESASQSLKLLQGFDYSEMERQRIYHELRKIQTKVSELLIKASNTEGYLDSFVETFDSYNNINTLETNANINLRHNYVTLASGNHDQRKVFLKDKLIDFTYKVFPNNGKQTITRNKEILSIKNALDESQNTVWIQELGYDSSGPSVEKAEGIITLDLKEIMDINSISVLIQSPKPVQLEINYSENGESFYKVPWTSSKKVTYETNWIFPNVNARYIKIIMTKWEEDIKEENENIFVFGLKSIIVERTAYAEKSKIRSLPYSLPNSASNLALDVIDAKPNETNIDYFIGMTSEPNEEPQWRSILPQRNINDNNILKLQDFEKVKLYFNDTSKLKTINGIDIYSNSALNGIDYVPKSVRLFQGYMQVHAQSCVMDSSYTGGDNLKEHIPSPNDWILTDNEALKVNKNFDLVGNNSIKLNDLNTPSLRRAYYITTNLFLKESAKTTLTKQSTENLNEAIYINGNLVYQNSVDNNINETVTELVTLKKGWNRVEIFLIQVNDFSETLNYQIPIDLYSAISLHNIFTVSSKNAMILVDPFILTYNTSINTKNRFAIENGNILFNYKTNNEKFLLMYDKVPGLSNRYLHFKAELKRNSHINTITPKLSEYRIRVS